VLAQLRLDSRLLAGARAQRAGQVLARRAVGGELVLERVAALAHGRERRREHPGERLGRGRERPVALQRAPEPLDPRRPLRALGALALGAAPLGRELALDLSPVHRRLARLGRPPALVDQPRRAALGLLRRRVGALRLAGGALGVVAGRVGRGRRRPRRLDGGERGLLGSDRVLGRTDERVAPGAQGQHALGAAPRRLAQLAGEAQPRPPVPRDRDPEERGRQRSEVIDEPRVGEQAARDAERGLAPADEVAEAARAGRRRRGRARAAGRARARDQGAPAVRAGALEQRAAGRRVLDERRAEPAAERRRERELEAGLDLEAVGERDAAARRTRVRAQALVGGRELAAHARGLPASGVGRAFGGPARAARDLARLVGVGELRAARCDRGRELRRPRGGRRALALERRELALERLRPARVELGELGLERLDVVAAGVVGRVLGGPRAEGLELVAAALGALRQRRRRLARALEAQLDALRGRPRGERPARERLAPLGAAGQRLLGLLAALGDLGQRPVGRVAGAARGRGARFGLRQLRPAGAQLLAGQRPARLVALALEPREQLGRLGLTLERPQPRARLALDVERAVEVVLRALELELRAAAALAVLAEARGLLDEQPPVARLGGDDRLDAALGDDGVHLLAQARVGEDLEHVDEPAAGAVEPVLPLAPAVEPAQDRDLAGGQVDPPVRVVEHELDLGARARLHAVPAAEDDVLHRLAADRERRLLAHRPQDGVGDVRLARAVRPDDDRDSGSKLQARAVGERLEALQRYRLEVHRSLVLVGGVEHLERGAGGLLLCMLLRAPRARSYRAPRDGGGDLERAVVRWPELGGHLVGDDVPALGQALLERGLEVDGMAERVLDLGREGLDDRGGRPLVARVQVAGADDGLDDAREHALGGDERRGRLADPRRRRGREQLGDAEALRDGATRRAGDGLRADLRQPAGAEALGLQARVEVRRDGQAEHRVAEEGQPRVGVRRPVGPRGMREDLLAQAFGQLVEEGAQAFQEGLRPRRGRGPRRSPRPLPR
jgi:hypothetical protein